MTAPARVLLALAALAGAAAASLAEERPTETVQVEGEGATTSTDPTGSVTVLRADQFEARITTVAELLQEAVGLRVRSYGGLGAFATVSIRGSTAEQVGIYLDGVLLNPALGGGVNLADLSLSGVDSVEVYRGFVPSHLATGAIGGAINIRTRRSHRQGATASGSVAVGSYGTAQLTGLASWSRAPAPGTSSPSVPTPSTPSPSAPASSAPGPSAPGSSTAGVEAEPAGGDAAPAGARAADALISVDLGGSEGDFVFYDNNGTPHTSSDDGFETRRNNRFRMADLMGKGGIGLRAGGRLEAETTFSKRRQGVPGIDAFQSLDAQSEVTRASLRLGLAQKRFLDGTLQVDADAYYGRTWQEFEDRSGDTTGGVSTATSTVTDVAGPQAVVRWHPRSGGRVRHFSTLLGSARRETASKVDHLNPVPDRGRAERLSWTLGAEDELHLSGGRWIVTPSVRWESYTSSLSDAPGAPIPTDEESDTYLTGRLGAAWRPSPGLGMRASTGRFHREPSFIELFGDQGSVKGNPTLTAESGWNSDIGAYWQTGAHGVLDRMQLEGSLFHTEAENLIQFVQTSQNRVTAQNTGRARVIGAELSASLGLYGRLSGVLAYTWQVAEDRSDTFRRGSDLPGRPRHELDASASLAMAWGRPYYRFSYIGPNYFDPAAAAVANSCCVSRDQVRVPGRYLHGIGFERALGRRASLTLEVDNLFDVKTVDVARYPLPGRLVQAKMRFSTP